MELYVQTSPMGLDDDDFNGAMSPFRVASLVRSLHCDRVTVDSNEDDDEDEYRRRIVEGGMMNRMQSVISSASAYYGHGRRNRFPESVPESAFRRSTNFFDTIARKVKERDEAKKQKRAGSKRANAKSPTTATGLGKNTTTARHNSPAGPTSSRGGERLAEQRASPKPGPSREIRMTKSHAGPASKVTKRASAPPRSMEDIGSPRRNVGSKRMDEPSRPGLTSQKDSRRAASPPFPVKKNVSSIRHTKKKTKTRRTRKTSVSLRYTTTKTQTDEYVVHLRDQAKKAVRESRLQKSTEWETQIDDKGYIPESLSVTSSRMPRHPPIVFKPSWQSSLEIFLAEGYLSQSQRRSG